MNINTFFRINRDAQNSRKFPFFERPAILVNFFAPRYGPT